jgi:alpha,alpha-trehalase
MKRTSLSTLIVAIACVFTGQRRVAASDRRARVTSRREGKSMRDHPRRRPARGFLIAALLAAGVAGPRGRAEPPGPSTRGVAVDVPATLDRLICEEDTDGDTKITVADPRYRDGRGDRRFWLTSKAGTRHEVSGTYYLSNLLQELKLAQDAGSRVARIEARKVFESPVDRVSRSIHERYWDGLTRRLDGSSLDQLLRDEKISTRDSRYLYVPPTDPEALAYYSELARRHPEWKFRVERLPARITPEYVRGLEGKHGLLSLALRRTPGGDYAGVPFVVPGGRFNEMYGWDSYFIALGLLEDGRDELARGMVDNHVYQITHYGKVLNANRTYYLLRSQPPLLTSMALAVYERLPRDDASRAWLARVLLAAIREYREVWMGPDRLDTATGLSHYAGGGSGVPPEVEQEHFDPIFQPHAVKQGLGVREFEAAYKAGRVRVPKLDAFFVHDAAVRESGHDTTYRWSAGGDRCADFVTVDLNALLYKVELDIARVIDGEFGGSLERPDGIREASRDWHARSDRRRDLIDKYLWDERQGLYFDYDVVNGRRSEYVSATTFYPLWAGHPDDPARRLITPERAGRLVASALPLLEMPGGLAASAERSRGPITPERPQRQWDYPNGWAPHQMLAWRGLLNYGHDATAHRLVYRWLYAITRNAADYHGTVPEKLDVVERSHAVFAEYGNQGTEFAYITREGFGWMNASYQVGLRLLPPEMRGPLERLVPPEWLFEVD